MQVDRCFKSFESALKAWARDKSKFTGKPKLPKYKDKIKGRNILTYTIQAVSKSALKKGVINLSKTNIKIPTTVLGIKQARLVPITGGYCIEIVYEDSVRDNNLNKSNVAGVDLGINILAAVTSNVKVFKPQLVCGKAIKSCNQQYNRRKAILQSLLPKNQFSSNKINGLTKKRNNKVDYYLHTASRFIINRLVEFNIGTLIIGKNDGWKQDINLGDKTNQKFNNIPHDKFISQLKYKAELVGIEVIFSEESYTSKTSFVDLEPICKHQTYKGKRVKRGLFKSSNGLTYNADCNGSANIARKVVGDAAFGSESVERCVVHPVRVKPYKVN